MLTLWFGQGRSLQIRHGDLTKEDVEIIVNAANDLLQHGSGTDIDDKECIIWF